jgi:hypothetical protein
LWRWQRTAANKSELANVTIATTINPEPATANSDWQHGSVTTRQTAVATATAATRRKADGDQCDSDNLNDNLSEQPSDQPKMTTMALAGVGGGRLM